MRRGVFLWVYDEKQVDYVKRETGGARDAQATSSAMGGKMLGSPGTAQDNETQPQDTCVTLNFLRATLEEGKNGR